MVLALRAKKNQTLLLTVSLIGTVVKYQSMVSTMAIDQLAQTMKSIELQEMCQPLIYSSTNVIGIGIRGSRPSRIGDKCWVFNNSFLFPFALLLTLVSCTFANTTARSTELPSSPTTHPTTSQRTTSSCLPSDLLTERLPQAVSLSLARTGP